MRHDVGDGWVEIRDPRQVTERQRRPAKYAMSSFMQFKGEFPDPGMSAEQIAEFPSPSQAAMEAADRMNDSLIVAFVSAWSWDVPVQIDTVADCPEYDAVSKLVAPLIADLFPEATLEVSTDPKAPTGV